MGSVLPWAYSITSVVGVTTKTSPLLSEHKPLPLPPPSMPTSLPFGYVKTNTPDQTVDRYIRSSLFASGSIHDVPRSACCAIASLCGIAPGAPIGGCDPPQPASI